jgi:glutamate-1-semialdehyde 2,1-aminomutase
MTAGIPDSAGVPKGCTQDTLSAIYNDAASVEQLFDAFPDQIAAVIVEPVGANMGVVPPAPGFLEALRSLCSRYGAVLIFDEVITGFRLGFSGAQGYFGVDADLVTYGKIIGAGMPVGAYGGKREIMQCVAPAGPVYQAGTLSGNPVAMAAGMAQLTILKEQPELYTRLNKKGDWFYGEIRKIAEQSGRKVQVNSCGSLGCIFFTGTPVTDYESAKTSDTAMYAKYFRNMLDGGIYLAPAQFEAMFLSTAHTREELEGVLDRIRGFFSCFS